MIAEHQSLGLAVELSFYLALPLLAALVLGRPVEGASRLSRWRPALVLAGLVAVAVIWRTYYTIHADGLGGQTLWLPAFLDWFGAGMALAWVRERPAGVPPLLREVAATPGACWSLALAGYWLGTTEQGGPYGLAGPTAAQALFKHLLFLVIATLLLVPAVFGEPSARWHRLAVRPLWRWFGQISFGVFLWHPMLLDAIRLLLGLPAFGGGFWLTLVLTLAASILAAAISWK